MAFFRRLSQLVTADAHAVLDLMEEPEALLKQALREMEQEIESLKKELKRTQIESDQFAAQEQSLRSSVTAIDSDLDLCIKTENQLLARSLVKKKLVVKKQQIAIQSSIKINEQNTFELAQMLAESEREFQTILTESKILMASKKTFDNSATIMAHDVITEEDVDIALLQEIEVRKAS